LSLRELFLSPKAVDVLYESEMALVDPEVRHSRDRIENLLHHDFAELGSTGEVYDRATMIEMMVSESPGRVMIRDFTSTTLSDEVALVSYRSIGTSGQEVRRTSVWIREEDRWQLRHHQGTRVADIWSRTS
jgi:ribonuclease HI